MQNNLTRNLIDLYLLCYRISWLLTFTDLNHCAGLFAAPLFLPGQNRSRKCCVSTFRRSRILFKMQPRNRIFDASMSGPHKDATMITVNARFGSSSSWGPELRVQNPRPKASDHLLRFGVSTKSRQRSRLSRRIFGDFHFNCIWSCSRSYRAKSHHKFISCDCTRHAKYVEGVGCSPWRMQYGVWRMASW